MFKLEILYWKYLQDNVFLHGHGDYEKIRKTTMMCEELYNRAWLWTFKRE